MPDDGRTSCFDELDRILAQLTQSPAEARDLSREHGFDDVEFRELVAYADGMLDALANVVRGHTLH